MFRLLTALVLGVLTISGILLLPVFLFPWVALSVLLLGVWEWARFVTPRLWLQILYCISIGLACVVALCLPTRVVLCWGALGWSIITCILIYARSHFDAFHAVVRDVRSYVQMVWGLWLFIPAWIGLQVLYHQGAFFLLWVLLLIAAMDTGAYYVGKRYGRHRLAPSISPGKTWEGFLGGGVCTTLVAGAVVGFFPGFVASWGLLWSVLGVVVIFSVVGDLWESVQKRLGQVKDSGRWLPGHGGVLDRMDSLLAVVPMVALIVSLWGL